MEKGIPVLIFFMLLLSTSTPNIITDQSALLSLKARITSDPRNTLQDWNLSSSPVCNWTGVTCGSRHLRVTALNISYMELAGEIPAQLGNLSFLVSLEMTRNHFTGLIPQELSLLPRLRNLWLGENNLMGHIPHSIFNISTLESLDFTNNNLSGILPDNMGLGLPMLKELYLSTNAIHGRIPSTFAAYCRQLRFLVLSNNNFAGTIPPQTGGIRMLEELFLGNNNLSGTIPSELGQLRRLQILNMAKNTLTGTLPSTLFNLSSLQELVLNKNKLSGSLGEGFGNLTMLAMLYLHENDFTGAIPQRIGKLSELQSLVLGINPLSGFIPSDIFNMSSMIWLGLTDNNLLGRLPSTIGSFLPNLEAFQLAGNKFDGVLPSSITNCSELGSLDLADNRFTGPIPNSLGDLRLLEDLNLWGNNFTSSHELSFLTSLSNCKYLTDVDVNRNPLNGILPTSVGNLSSSLTRINFFSTGIYGDIPRELGNLSELVSLSLSDNSLHGVIPTTIYGLQNLQELLLLNNQLSGSISNSLCNLNNMGDLDMSHNQLRGPIPECLGNVSSLRYVDFSFNNLTSHIPDSISDLQNILELDISSNSLTGSLSPQIENLKVLSYLNLSANRLSGDIPNAFQGLQNVASFSLAHNNFQGSIPDSIGDMLSLISLDLSHNNLSGTIPKSLESLRYLEYLNVSFNQLSGEIPQDGPFENFRRDSFMSNLALCGLPRYQVSICRELERKSKTNKRTRVMFIVLPIIGVGLLTSLLAFILVRRCRKTEPETASLTVGLPRISYYDVLQSTNGLSDDNLLGRGCFGAVYKGIFRDGVILAIKVFNVQLEGAFKTFDVECEVLRNLRHRNLIKVISSCSNQDFKALLLEYMPNGSLEKWLYSIDNVLSLLQRLSIMMDVASALEYLHHGYTTPVVHCDLKPSNVLLDEYMTAHVSDFGISKLLGEGESTIHTRTLATIGYMAPEYGLDGRVSTSCDVYSYGILLIETFTSKQPGDEMFSGNLNIKNWVKGAIPTRLSEVIDTSLIRLEEEHFEKDMSCVASVLDLAMSCTADSPGQRMNMKDLVAELKKIKNRVMV